SDVRYRMLANSFSFLPLRHDSKPRWIRDVAVAKYLRGGGDPRVLLAEKIADAIKDNKLETTAITVVAEDREISSILPNISDSPLLVRRSGGTEIVGIVTAYDLL